MVAAAPRKRMYQFAGLSMMASEGAHPVPRDRGGNHNHASRNGRAKPKQAANHATGATRIRQIITSDFLAKRDLQKRILAAVDACGYDSHIIFGIKLALEEALINAIKHGNKLDSRKKVRVSAVISPRRVDITVEDEGVGFSRNGVPNPLLDENLEKCSGRGILLIESYMDSVRWSNHGRRLRMVKERTESHSGRKS